MSVGASLLSGDIFMAFQRLKQWNIDQDTEMENILQDFFLHWIFLQVQNISYTSMYRSFDSCLA